jgi:hypothetical protein
VSEDVETRERRQKENGYGPNESDALSWDAAATGLEDLGADDDAGGEESLG